jgi:hypothetical protein
MGDAVGEWQIGPPAAFADLGFREKADVLREFISWGHYGEQGLDWRDQDAILTNVAEGKPPDRWLEGTAFLEASRQGGAVKTPQEAFRELLSDKSPPAPAKEPDRGIER